MREPTRLKDALAGLVDALQRRSERWKRDQVEAGADLARLDALGRSENQRQREAARRQARKIPSALRRR